MLSPDSNTGSATYIKKDSIDEDTQEQILQKIADNHNYILIHQGAIQLTPAQVMVVRNWVGTSTNGMYRLKQVLEIFCPELEGKLLPRDIRKILQELEQMGVVPVSSCQVELQIAGNKEKTGLRTYYYVTDPGHILELQTARSILDGSYRNSQVISSKNDKLIMVFGIDKSDTDLLCSQRVANRKDGNSRNHVQPIACAEKCAETYSNCEKTILKKGCLTQRYLQNGLDDNYQMMSLTIGSKLHSDVKPKQATCALFLPFPLSSEPFTN